MGKKLKNAVGTLFLVLAIAATQIPVSDVEAVTSSASDFQLNGDTLVKYTGTATAVSVPEGVKKIGPEAFLDDTDLYAVYLPDGLTTIEHGAFSNCTVLSVVDFPDSLHTIGNFAFSNCKTLSDVEIGKNITELGYGVFAGCEMLKDIQIDSDSDYFSEEAGVLYNKSRTKVIQALAGSDFTKYNMPATIEKIEPYAFWGCDDLRFVELSGSLQTIPGYAFSNCTGIEKITLPNSVKSIGTKAFADCVNLEEAFIPSSVTSIHETAFDGCPKLQIAAEPDSFAAEYDKSRDKSDVSSAEYQDTENRTDAASAIAEMAENIVSGDVSKPNTELTTLQAPSSAQEYGSTSIVGGRAVVFIDNRSQTVYGSAPLKSADTRDAFPDSSVEQNKIVEDTVSGADYTAVSGNSTENDQKGGGFPKYTVTNGKIAAQAYYQDQELSEYQFPQGITGIGDFAFARTSLQNITIPEGVTSIGYGAFYHCDRLKNVSIPSTVTEIEPYAFEDTAWLNSWKNGGSVEDYKIVGGGILIAYKGTDGKITIPEGVKKIAAGVFKDHKGITDVSLPNTLKIIGEEAFAGCSNLKTVSGGVAVTDIQDRAFAGCPISTVRIPESVQKIGLGAYDQSACGGAANINAVVFMGNTLPELSYEKTAQRLSNNRYRCDAFKGIEVAVVGAGMTDFDETILDKDGYGFHGTICSLVQESKGGAAGILHPIMLTKSSDSEKAKLPEAVSIYQKPYRFESTEGITEESASRKEQADTITVWENGTGLENKVTAVLNNHSEPFILEVKESSEAKSDILPAYQTLYGQGVEPDMVCYDIALYDQSRQIPITKLGRESMKITMPVPAGMENGALHVVCTDDDGQLEEADAQVFTQDRETFVTFEAKHFSPYAIYCYENGQGAVVLKKNGGALTSLSRKKDASPDTGDWIHPKWFLATGLLALSMMTFFLKGNRRKTPGIK
ncbi:MAG: leucine-rich repeat domain-containing protein [Clostridiales bacterium]|nr:leucine-rich repeat domain-containing protein [Clostridiales bacterium]